MTRGLPYRFICRHRLVGETIATRIQVAGVSAGITSFSCCPSWLEPRNNYACEFGFCRQCILNGKQMANTALGIY